VWPLQRTLGVWNLLNLIRGTRKTPLATRGPSGSLGKPKSSCTRQPITYCTCRLLTAVPLFLSVLSLCIAMYMFSNMTPGLRWRHGLMLSRYTLCRGRRQKQQGRFFRVELFRLASRLFQLLIGPRINLAPP
jgi:hypothetical protein